MKIKFLPILALLLIGTVGFGQIGIRAGVNLANFSAEDYDGSAKLGFNLGLFYQIEAGDMLMIQPELNFMQQGSKSSFDFGGTKVESSITTNYIQVPLLVKAVFGDRSATSFFVEAGPYLGYGLSGSNNYCEDEQCETESIDWESDGVKRMDYGIQAGAGVNINANLFINARYILGLANINEDSTETIKNTGINIALGYSF